MEVLLQNMQDSLSSSTSDSHLTRAEHYSVPVLLTMSLLACSIASCSAVCIHYLAKKHGLSDTPDRLLFCLALADLVGASIWFLDINLPGRLCPYSGVVNMFGYQSAQFWTCIIGAYLIITCSAKLPPPEFVFYVLALGVPALIQVAILSLHLYKNHPPPHGCWVQYGNLQILFVTFPQLLSAVLNFAFLITIVYKMRISARRWGLKSRDRGLFFVMVCFLLTTVSAILEAVPEGSETVYTVATCFGALQGFFNSIAMKQKAILLFMGTVKTKFYPSTPKPRPLVRNYSTMKSADTSSPPSTSTWLLSDEESSVPKHPAMTDTYTDYYARSLNRASPQSSTDNVSLTPFPNEPVSPPPSDS